MQCSINRFTFVLALLTLGAGHAYSQNLSAACTPILNAPIVYSCPFAPGFSYISGSYVKLNGNSNAVVNGATSDSGAQVVGIPLKIVQSRVILQVSGSATINFDGATTSGDTFTVSSTTNGYFHDSGGTTCSSTTVGVLSQTIGSAGQATGFLGPCTPAAGSSITLPLSVTNGGTGQANTVGSAGHVLRSNGTTYADSAIQAADVPTLNQNTSGSAGSLSAVLVEGSGGTGANNAPGSAGHVLRSNGSHYVDSAIQSGDLPTLSTTVNGATCTIGSSCTPSLVQNLQSTAYTTVIGDCGKDITHPSTDNNARTYTIDSNANVAAPVGCTINFTNLVNTVTIAITSDTLQLGGTSTTGSRTIAVGGWAVAKKVGTTLWLIAGPGTT